MDEACTMIRIRLSSEGLFETKISLNRSFQGTKATDNRAKGKKATVAGRKKTGTSYNVLSFANYNHKGNKILLLAVILSSLMLNSLSLIDYIFSKTKIDSLFERMQDVFMLSSSSGAYSFLIGLTYSRIIDMKGIPFNSPSLSATNQLYIGKMEEYIKKFSVLSTSKNIGESSNQHICQVALNGYLAEDKNLNQKKLMKSCLVTVPSQDVYTPVQAAFHLASVYNEMKMNIEKNRMQNIDSYIMSINFHEDDENIMYFCNGIKFILNQIVEKLMVEITIYNQRVSWQIYVFSFSLLLIIIIYKLFWLPKRQQGWDKIKTCLLLLNDDLLLSTNIKILLQ